MADAPPRRLADGPTPSMAPKARTLAVLAVAGVPVPAGWVVTQGDDATQAVDELLARGPIAVRSAAADEDGVERSGAGLAHSTLGVTSAQAARAAMISIGTAQCIVQQQIAGRWLVVAAVTEHGVEVEVHAGRDGLGPDMLAGGATPQFHGPLRRWADPVAGRLQATVDDAVRVAHHAGLRSQHGWDLELVIDADTVWVVQLRPLTAAPHPGWPAFAAAVATAQGQAAPVFPPGRLTLDAEHNPAPLSVAHAWLMAQLACDRPTTAGSPVVLAGWLYVATLPRDLPGEGGPGAAPALSAHDALRHLQGELLPRARQRLDATMASLRTPVTPGRVREALDHAWATLLWMIDAYVGVLIPARRAAGRAQPAIEADDLLTLRERAQYLDVLPSTWDIASPTLAELGVTLRAADRSDCPTALPTDPARAATLLAEWDDHLFALGLAPLRGVYRWVGDAAGLGPDVFLLRGPELPAAARGQWPDLDARRDALQHAQTLQAPLCIEDGHPVTVGGRGPWAGIPIGTSFTGHATIRADLAALLARPPSADAVVMMPALTAPAAAALRSTGVRAVCSEHGGPFSHAALMARELGLSALIGCQGCTTVPEGTRVTLDTTTGRLRVPAGD